MTSPDPESRTISGLTRWWRGLSYIIAGHERRFLLCIILGLASNGFVSAANPLALKYLFDEGIIRGDFQRFVLTGLGFVLIFTLWRGGVYLYRLFSQNLKNDVVKGHSLRMLDTFYGLPYQEVIRRERGYFMSRIYDEVATSSALVMDTTLSISNMAITLMVALVIATSISYRAAVMVLIAVPVVYALSRKYGNLIKRESKTEKEEEAKVRGTLERTVGAYKPARLFDLQPVATRRVEQQLGSYIGAFFNRFKTSTRYETLSGIFMSYVETIAIVSAGYEILRGRMTFGGFMGFMTAFWAIMGAVRGLFGLIPELSRAEGQVERMREFEQTETDQINVRRGSELVLDGVGFRYGTQEIFRDLALVLVPGEKVLVVGPNGSGKSTLAHLVVGLLEPTDGVTNTLSLDRISALVLPYDFVPGTVADNLRFVRGTSPPQFETLVDTLDLGALLDQDPCELSAGQRKRLEIAMVLSKPADLYILDEPLAGIDVDSKETIIDAIMNATEGRTLLAVMHGDADVHLRFDRQLTLDPRGNVVSSPLLNAEEPVLAHR